jgi:DHA2 family multidrug resistance protein
MSAATITSGGPSGIGSGVAGRAAAAPALEPIPPHRLIAFVAMCFGMFMAFLDIQIVSSSLADIQAGLSASADEIPWVQTAYLIAEVIAIPLSGFLSRALGTRILFAVSAGGFTIASVMCGLSSSINSMIVWRALQGFIGGGMVPTVFASAYLIFQGPRQKFVAPVVGLIATLAPTVGPTVGGYLTDAISWHWLFFINVVPGIIVTTTTFALVDFDKPDLSLLQNFDWIGLISMAGFLGALEYVLEDGPRYEWFDDDTVFTVAMISGISALVFFARALTAKAPIVDLYAFANRNFSVGSLFSFVLGIGLYGLTYLYPVYLAQIRGYNALMIGETLFVSGVVMFATAPIAGQLSEKLDPRIVLASGFIMFAIGTWQMTYLTSDWDFWELLWPQVFRGVGLMLSIIPVTNTALGTLPPDRVKNASGLFNLMRNLGGAIGLAAINTWFNDRLDLHLTRLHEAVNYASIPANETLSELASRLPGSDAPSKALAALNAMVRLQAEVMSYADVFLMMTVLFLTLAACAALMKRPRAAAGAGH